MPTANAPTGEPPAITPARGQAQSWAARLCGEGPHPAPLNGPLQATALPHSEPTALDPKDQGFHLYEGAVWFDGAFHFSDFKTTDGFPSRILKYQDGKLSVVVLDSGSNGVALDPTGTHLVLARHKSKSVARFLGSDRFEHVVETYQGKPFNSPNDLVFRSDGHLYFTDPGFQAGKRRDQKTTNVYHVAPNGSVTVVDDSIKNPNGISLSPDEKTLYVAGNMQNGYLKRYPVSSDGSVGAGEILVQPVEVPDGMAVDCSGNLYLTEHTLRRIRVVTPEGKELGRITGMDANVTNVAFGGPQHKTLFITGTGKLFQVELPVPGMPY